MQNHHKISNDLDPGVDHQLDEAQQRFESNRRYDQRPATQNVGRPNLVLTTRDGRTATNRWSAGTAWLIGLCLLVGLSAGVIIGLRLWSAYSPTGDSEQTARGLESEISDQVASPTPASDLTSPLDLTSPSDPAATTTLLVETDFLTSLEGLELERLDFIPGGTELTPGGQEILQDLAATLTAHPEQPVELSVRTYSELSPGRNHGLSVKQADALSSALIAEGVEPGRMTVIGLGSSDIERPSSAAALFLESSSPQFRTDIESLGPLVLDEPLAETLSPDLVERLALASTAVGDSSILLVGYAWSESTEHLNHQVSHDLLDRAVALLTQLGVDADQISTVGMGDVVVSLDGRRSIVSVDAGESAAIAVLLGGISLDAVSFEPGTTTLTSSGSRTLLTVAETLKNEPEVQIEVAVHSYDGTSSQDNHDKSQLKAKAIGQYLMSAGVSPDQVLLMGHGDPGHFAAPGRDSAVTFTVIR